MPEPTHLEIVPLGGLGEFGMNMMLYRWGRDAVLIDAGMMFPGSEHLGVDVVIPDLTFLEECGTIHGVVLTHGHEDHIGALPFVLARHDVPVYSAPYTEGLVRSRLREHDLGARLLRLPLRRELLELGPFRIETVPVAHSIPQAAMVVLRTPVGTIVHTADFKLDPSPPDGIGTDLDRLAEIAREGVLALLSDSTNAEVEGVTPGELSVRPALDRLIGGRRGRVFVTTFASNVARVQQVVDLADRHGRRVALVGSSIRAHADVAESLGLLRFPPGARAEPEQAMELPPERVVFVASGSQGEPMSALARIAVDKHREVRIDEGDLVIHSARVIPGNEKSIDRLVNHLLRRGADVVTAANERVHVSGHPSREELGFVLRLLRPRFLIPIHGEYRQMLAHARLARSAGMADEAVVLADTGDVVALGEHSCGVVDRVQVGQVFIDGTLEEVDLAVLRDRRQLAGDGIVVAVVALDRGRGRLARPPELLARGFVPDDADEGLLAEAGRVLSDALDEVGEEERGDEAVLKAEIHAVLKRFFRRRVQRRPMIVPVLVEF